MINSWILLEAINKLILISADDDNVIRRVKFRPITRKQQLLKHWFTLTLHCLKKRMKKTTFFSVINFFHVEKILISFDSGTSWQNKYSIDPKLTLTMVSKFRRKSSPKRWKNKSVSESKYSKGRSLVESLAATLTVTALPRLGSH